MSMWPPGGNASCETTRAPTMRVFLSSTRSACSSERTMTNPVQRIWPSTTRSPSTIRAPVPFSLAPLGTVRLPSNWVMAPGAP